MPLTRPLHLKHRVRPDLGIITHAPRAQDRIGLGGLVHAVPDQVLSIWTATTSPNVTQASALVPSTPSS